MNKVESEIVIDKDICNGKPTIKGTRITVQSILDYISAGDSFEDILEAYPTLKKEDILASLKFTSSLMDRNFEITSLA